MSIETRLLYRSANGDCWHLHHDSELKSVCVQHTPNASSGGRPSMIAIETFLGLGRGPEQQALLRLIASLAGDDTRSQGEPVAGVIGAYD